MVLVLLTCIAPEILLLSLCSFLIFETGIGYSLAKEFLKAGDNIVICSRSGKDRYCVPIFSDLYDMIWSLHMRSITIYPFLL